MRQTIDSGRVDESTNDNKKKRNKTNNVKPLLCRHTRCIIRSFKWYKGNSMLCVASHVYKRFGNNDACWAIWIDESNGATERPSEWDRLKMIDRCTVHPHISFFFFYNFFFHISSMNAWVIALPLSSRRFSQSIDVSILVVFVEIHFKQNKNETLNTDRIAVANISRVDFVLQFLETSL